MKCNANQDWRAPRRCFQEWRGALFARNAACMLIVIAATFAYGDEVARQPPVRGVIPRAQRAVTVDGQLQEYTEALCTPLEYFHPDLKNRPAQVFYLWDDEAIYLGIRTLDEAPFAPEDPFWVGDALEWYLDTRRGSRIPQDAWGPGAVHCFFSGVRLDQVAPQFSLRPGYEDAIAARGVQVASRRTAHGLEFEFKMPWSNFPDFMPTRGAILGIDAELSYSDGVSRSYRSFVFGGPLSVEHPANLANVELVESLQADHWRICGPVMMPIRIDVPWDQPGRVEVEGRIARPPHHPRVIGRVVFEVRATDGSLLGEHEAAEEEVIQADGLFVRRVARWPVDLYAAGAFLPVAVVYDRHGGELARIAPRLTSVNMEQGY